MKYVVFSVFAILLGHLTVDAYVPVIVNQDSLHDIDTITDTQLSQAFYGTLNGFPQTYEIVSTEPFHLFAHILVPDIDSSKNTVSGIIIKKAVGNKRVTEITRLHANDAQWDSFYEPFGGDSYRNGATYEGDLDAGVYRIEVSTPDNLEKYVLVVGKEERFGAIGYFTMLGRIMDVKVFFEKSRIRIVESPFVYVPLSILGFAYWFFWYRRKRRIKAREV